MMKIMLDGVKEDSMPRIQVTLYAIEQFKKRILQNNAVDDEYAKVRIMRYFQHAGYVGDSSSGILFRNRDKNIEFIVKERKIVTLFPINN